MIVWFAAAFDGCFTVSLELPTALREHSVFAGKGAQCRALLTQAAGKGGLKDKAVVHSLPYD
jgi:hypothetical protein